MQQLLTADSFRCQAGICRALLVCARQDTVHIYMQIVYIIIIIKIIYINLNAFKIEQKNINKNTTIATKINKIPDNLST